MARGTLYRVLAVIILMMAVQTGAFLLTMSSAPRKIEDAFSENFFPWIFFLAFAAVTMILCRMGCDWGSKPGYTLRRLSISEKTVFAWQSTCNALCYFLLWAAELLTVLAMCAVYMHNAPEGATSNQTVFLAFYRSPFLHSLMPLEEVSRWVRNVFFAAGLGMASAHFPFKQRRGKVGLSVFLLGIVCMGFFSGSTGSFEVDILPGIIIILCMISMIFNVVTWKEEEENEEY